MHTRVVVLRLLKLFSSLHFYSSVQLVNRNRPLPIRMRKSIIVAKASIVGATVKKWVVKRPRSFVGRLSIMVTMLALIAGYQILAGLPSALTYSRLVGSNISCLYNNIHSYYDAIRSVYACGS
jgi:hypothetical protein